jgi:hypothetical protein
VFLEKNTPKYNICVNLEEIFFPYYNLWLWMLFLVILLLLEHFKVKLIAKSNKSLCSAFIKE